MSTSVLILTAVSRSSKSTRQFTRTSILTSATLVFATGHLFSHVITTVCCDVYSRVTSARTTEISTTIFL